MKNLFSIVITFLIGMVIAPIIGLESPYLFASAWTVLAVAVSLMKESNLAFSLVGLDLDDFSSALGAYSRKHEKAIQTAIFQDIEFEKYMRKVTGVSDEYSIGGAGMTEVLQPWQCGWTPKGESVFTALVNKVRQIKIDFTLGCLDDLYRTYLSYLVSEDLQPEQYPIVKWVIYNQLIPQIKEEIDYNSYNGVYAAPTPGTAGTSVSTVDGLAKVNADLIAAGSITEIATGAITSTNILEKVETFVDTVPVKYRNMATPIFMSKTNARRYYRDYRSNFGTNANFDGNANLKVDDTNKMIIGISAMEGSDRFIHTSKDNIMVMFDKTYAPNKLTTQLDKRDVCVLGDFKRGYGYGYLESVFLNDQA